MPPPMRLISGYHSQVRCGSSATIATLQLGLSSTLECAGTIEGCLTQRVAHTLTTEFIAHVDFVATIHSGGDSGAFQIAPVAGFLQPPTALLDSPRADDVDGPAKLASRRSQQQQTCTDCKMSAGVWAVERGSGTVQEAAEKLGIPSMFVAAAGALGGGAHGSNHDALGLVRTSHTVITVLNMASHLAHWRTLNVGLDCILRCSPTSSLIVTRSWIDYLADIYMRMWVSCTGCSCDSHSQQSTPN